MMLEFRVVNVYPGTLMLEHLESGRYLSIEVLAHRTSNRMPIFQAPLLMAAEKAWKNLVSKAYIHLYVYALISAKRI